MAINSKPLTIVVPMAGLGSRFADAGYTTPKPLIPILGVPMIQLVIANLRPSRPHRFIFICRREHLHAYELEPRFAAWAPGCEIVALDRVTEGAACTVLQARQFLGDGPLMIANSDQYVDTNIDEYLAIQDQGFDGLIMTMTARDPKWSFVGLDDRRLVTRVAEKQPISDEATVGIYNFAKASDFVRGADRMIAAEKRVNNEFYVAPVYNEMIADGAKIAICNIGSDVAGMYGLGTPADLNLFLSGPIAERATAVVR
ncbi:MAG: glycosyltransferase family 2 protein [Methylovirgula sp.]